MLPEQLMPHEVYLPRLQKEGQGKCAQRVTNSQYMVAGLSLVNTSDDVRLGKNVLRHCCDQDDAVEEFDDSGGYDVRMEVNSFPGEHSSVRFSISRRFSSVSRVARFGEISPFWQYFNSLRRLCEGLLSVEGKNLNLLWSTFYAIGQIFIFPNGQILSKNLAFWSHWRYDKMTELLFVQCVKHFQK